MACNTQKKEQCQDILNESKRIEISDFDSVCSSFKQLTAAGLSLRFLLKDEQVLPIEKERNIQSFFSSSDSEKKAIVFIDLSKKKFTTVFSPYLRKEEFLLKRKAFQEYIFSKIDRVDRNFFSQIILEYKRIFSSAIVPGATNQD